MEMSAAPPPQDGGQNHDASGHSAFGHPASGQNAFGQTAPGRAPSGNLPAGAAPPGNVPAGAPLAGSPREIRASAQSLGAARPGRGAPSGRRRAPTWPCCGEHAGATLERVEYEDMSKLAA